MKHCFRLVLVVAVLPMILTGCIDVTGQLTARRQRLLEERDELERRTKAVKLLFNERDVLQTELLSLEAQTEQIKQAIEGMKKEKP